MKALVIRQPWAWSIMHAGKDIENRSWSTKFRGRFLVIAAKGMTKLEHCAWWDFVMMQRLHHVSPPDLEQLHRGGIVGTVELVDVVTDTSSKWFEGPYGFVLRDPRPLSFQPFKGRLGFFDIPDVNPT